MSGDVMSVVREYARHVRRSLRRLYERPESLLHVSESWVPADTVRIAWFIQTYRDLPRLRRTLKRVRTLYPESQVLVVSDGDPDPAIRQVCDLYGPRFNLRDRLYGVEHGGELVQQILEAFLASDADVLLKIDPDTDVRRRFSIMPSCREPSIYGTVQSAGFGPNRIVSIQGGCIIVPRRAAGDLADSGLRTAAFRTAEAASARMGRFRRLPRARCVRADKLGSDIGVGLPGARP